MRSTGIVRSWDFDAGQGIIDSDDIPGGCVASAWAIRREAVTVDTSDGLETHGLDTGEVVDFFWRTGDDAYGPEITDVWPSRCAAPDSPSTGAYRTSLWMSATREDGVTIMREVDPYNLPPVPPRPPLPRTTGVVRGWHPEEGWGVVDSDATPGGAWVHFSEVHGTGYRVLTPGARVEFAWEAASQDGFAFRASDVDVIASPEA
ncbi:cold-shock protein [Williamsia deligens]|uniref:Cold shock domain-containing protein n=1 Tax=Williamsia deligens TaxID=321325 RepID=A0ABW3GAI9_9NOCA|nr:cold shock domain-containing protein [Williamsia deligens]MCP2193295.1 Cold shock protein, CspA family [Williamsia deligens]